MNQTKQKTKTANGPIAAAVYHLITIVLFPVMVVGYVLWIVKAFVGRGRSASGTAQGPLSARWFQHRIGTRPDEPSYRLLHALPGISPLALKLLFGPMEFAHRVSGYVPVTFRYPYEGEVKIQNEASARQTFFDSVVDRYLGDAAQLVILGAGFDTRALRLPKNARVKSFEVDTPQTMATKRAVVKKAGIDASGVTFVDADFEKEDWLGRLISAGFDPNKPALFLWEGVIMYLDKAAAEDTLRKVASTVKGSVIAFDYMTTEVLESQSVYFRAVRKSLSAAGEPLKFGIDSTPPSSERLSEFLQSCGLWLVDHRTLGQETAGKRAWGGFAIAKVK